MLAQQTGFSDADDRPATPFLRRIRRVHAIGIALAAASIIPSGDQAFDELLDRIDAPRPYDTVPEIRKDNRRPIDFPRCNKD